MSAPLPPEKIRALLGGYAAGNLTAEERELLMAAALEDQALFDELLREEPLREALADPLTRAELLGVLPEARPRVPWWKMSWPYAALASAAAAIAIFVVFRPQPGPRLTAEARPPEAVQVAPKPEPVPSEIAVPRQLTLSPEAKEMGAKEMGTKEKGAKLISAQPAPVQGEGVATAAAGGTAKEESVREARAVGGVQAAREMPPAPLEKSAAQLRLEQTPGAPPPAAVSPQADAVRVALQAAPGAALPEAALKAARQDAAPKAERGNVTFAKRSADRARTALEVEVAAMEGDGSWKTAAPGAAVPAGRPLRLKVTSPVDGTVEMDPRLAPALRVRGGVPAEWTIPAQAKGELRLRLRVRLAEPGTVFRAYDAGQLPAGAAAAPPSNGPGAGPLLVRDIFLKVE